MWQTIGLRKEGACRRILTASTATGQLILLPILAMIIENYSWRWAIGLIMMLSSIMFVVILFFMKNKPKDVGILPYGLEKEIAVNDVAQRKTLLLLLSTVFSRCESERILVISC